MNDLTTQLRGNRESRQTRFALKVTACLAEQTEHQSAEIGERLRFARECALEKARAGRRTVPQALAITVVLSQGIGRLLSGRTPSWWPKLASVVPLIMLLMGLPAIEELHDRNQIDAAAEIDVALLSDRLPPIAYRDAGFVEFLKTSAE
jgi:uncharacterized protein DUF3619